jgi:hypothetical protein
MLFWEQAYETIDELLKPYKKRNFAQCRIGFYNG